MADQHLKATDWMMVRQMMNAAIDFCEKVEASGCHESDRAATTVVDGQAVSVQDVLTSAWTYPEAMRYAIIRQRHEDDDDLAYVPETARILTAMAAACAELCGSKSGTAEAAGVAGMLAWFETHAGDTLESAIAKRRAER
jgi:L-serine deaminase